jgi:ABC-type dipeptide/oligopeptide/nickel transport system permease subunit
MFMKLYHDKDKLWLAIWLAGVALLWLWNMLFLNRPAFAALLIASHNTLFVGALVVVFSFLLGWGVGLAMHFLDEAKNKTAYLSLTFFVNIVRSIPQIIGVLIGYIVLTILIANDSLRGALPQLVWMAFVISIFVFLEVADLIRERIAYYKKLDFFDAMLCCGIPERTIINGEILLKNSRAHLLHKLITIFGTTIFLLCSIDFIISVGLSTDVSLSNFPTTLGGLLAKGDSKQDILAIGSALGDWNGFTSLFFEHLQGISTAFIIVFTLLCIYKISNGFVQRFKL